MKKAMIVIGIAVSALFAYGSQYVSMTKYGAENIDYTWAKCYYKQSFGGEFRVSIIVKGSQYSCPYSIKYYPESGTWE